MTTYVLALRIFEPPAGHVKVRGVDASFPWFVRLSYAWFVITSVMVLFGDLYAKLTGNAPPHIYVGAWRHAATVGFITTLMVGLGYRLLPLFTGVDLWKPGCMRGSFWLLAVGNATRVIFELASVAGRRWVFLVMGSSGFLELTAIGVFGVSIWRTLNRRQQVLVAENQITPKTHLRWLLDNFPEAREELIRAGLRHLAKVNSPPSFVTLEQAASIHGLDAEDLVQRLSTILRPPPSAPATAEARHLPSAPSEIRKGS